MVNNGIINNFSITPRNLTQYKAYRGVTDFTQIGQFNQYETGYQFLSVIEMPKFMTMCGEEDAGVKSIVESFQHMLEYEFRGLDGLGDITADAVEITDGINTMRMINKVMMDTSVTVSMEYFEKHGSLIEKFSEYYLTGLHDRMTQAKTYHGLIKNNKMKPGYENEVFTLLYYVTDSTMLRLERAVLLANCQLTKAETSMYNGNRENMSNKPVTIEFNTFPIMGYEVDAAANYLLKNITGVAVYHNHINGTVNYDAKSGIKPDAELDSNDYRYGILGGPDYNPDADDTNISPSAIDVLVNAVEGAKNQEDDSGRYY